MYIIHKILFAVTVWFISLSIVLVSFAGGVTNPRTIQEKFDSADYKTILQEIDNSPLTEEIEYQYTLPYIILLSFQNNLDSDTVQRVLDENIENAVSWFKGETDQLKISNPDDTNTILSDNLDETSKEFINANKARINVCSAEQNQDIQENGYSATNFCIPAQVRNEQVSLTTYAGIQESNSLLSNLILGFDENNSEINPDNINYLQGWVNTRNTLLFAQQSRPFLIISSLALISLLYYTQKNRNENIGLEAINLTGYIAICTSLLSIIGFVLFNKGNLTAFVEQNSLPGLSMKITEVLSAGTYDVLTRALLPSLLIGIGLGLMAIISFAFYSKKIKSASNESEILQIHEQDVFDQSVLLATLPDTANSTTPNEKTMEIVEQIKDMHAKIDTEPLEIEPVFKPKKSTLKIESLSRLKNRSKNYTKRTTTTKAKPVISQATQTTSPVINTPPKNPTIISNNENKPLIQTSSPNKDGNNPLRF